MRWKITNKETTVGNQKIKTTNKQFLMTVGDIVGMGKSASAAVANAITNIKTLIKGFQDDPALVGQTAAATLINNLLQPLYVVIKGTEVYQTLMTVADIVTPIVQMVARGTGAWCSPGNIADIGQIVLGLVNEILIGIVTQIITKLKDWIWNYEFVVKNINEESSQAIIEILKSLQGLIQDKVKELLGKMTSAELLSWLSGSSGLTAEEVAATSEYRNRIKNTKSSLNSLSQVRLPDGTAASIMEALSGVPAEQYGPGWNSEYKVDQAGAVRIFRGSLSDKGIYYSDDRGTTWIQSDKQNSSFCCFAKINTGSEEIPIYRYLAGSCPYIKESNFIANEDMEWHKSNDQYDKDYYYYDSLKVKRYTKFEKDNQDISTAIFETKNSCYKADNFIPASGIWYSDDDGLTWTKSNFPENTEYIGNIFEFQPKENPGDEEHPIPTRVVACSYDYNGIWYSDDGIDWHRSKITYIDTPEDSSYGRWVSITDGSNNKIHVNTKSIRVAPEITPKVYTLCMAEPKANIISKAKFSITEAFEEINEKFGNMINEIVSYIHKHYNYERVDYYSEQFWGNLVDRIIDGEYTLEDAKSGKDLQYPIN